MKKYIKRILRLVYNVKSIRYFYPHATRWQTCKWKMARTMRNLTIAAVFIGSNAASARIYNLVHPQIVYADHEVQVNVPVTEALPILDRIIKCESGGQQFDKNGQVLMNINVQKDGTRSVDEGIGQINVQTWGATATRMGYDLAVAADNMAFAKWLFLNQGDAPWSASRGCWAR